MNELESLNQQLEELKALRARLTSVDNAEELNEDSADIREYLKDEIDLIDKEIKEIEEKNKETANQYEEKGKELQKIIDEYENKLESTNLLSEEEISELRYETEKRKLEINELSNEIKRRLDNQNKLIRALKSKKTLIEKNINNSLALGLTYNEYKDITSTIRKTSIMNKILETKGLGYIIDKKANERSKEEKQLLKEAKEEIINEISDFRKDKEYDDYSVLDIIEALYSLETTYKKVETPKEYKMTTTQLVRLTRNIQLLPYKVVNTNIQENNKTIEEAPKDMEGAGENEKVDLSELKPAEEKVTVFKDKDTEDYYVRKYAVDRFKLTSADIENEIRINGSVCYKISNSDVERIKENANNSFSPYIADIKEVSLEKDTKDELIPGTNIYRPRDRKVNETDEEYEEFLKNYYDKVFPQEATTEVVQEYAPSDEQIEEYESRNKKELTEEEISEVIEETTEAKGLAEEEISEVVEETTEAKGLSVEDISEVIEETTETKKLSEEEISNIVEEAMKEKTSVEEDLEPSNIQATDEFKDELKKGNILYNIVNSSKELVKRVAIGITNAYMSIKGANLKNDDSKILEDSLKRHIEQDYVYEAMLEDKLIDEEKAKQR